MRNGHAGVWHQLFDHGGHLLQVLDAVVDEEALPAPLELVGHRIPNQLAVKAVEDRFHRFAVGWGRGDDAQVADAEQGKL